VQRARKHNKTLSYIRNSAIFHIVFHHTVEKLDQIWKQSCVSSEMHVRQDAPTKFSLLEDAECAKMRQQISFPLARGLILFGHICD